MKITREKNIVEFEATPEGVTLKVHEMMTWEEWDRLVEAVKPPTVLGSEWRRVTYGHILPGDRVNGLVTDSHNYVRIRDQIVYRRILPGWEQVTTGRTKPGDLSWKCGETHGLGDATPDQDVGHYFYVLRRTV